MTNDELKAVALGGTVYYVDNGKIVKLQKRTGKYHPEVFYQENDYGVPWPVAKRCFVHLREAKTLAREQITCRIEKLNDMLRALVD